MAEKVALITGASRGIGKAVSEYLSRRDYHVILIARNKDKLKAVSNDIVKRGGSFLFML